MKTKENCLTLERCNVIAVGGEVTSSERVHLGKCKWCAYFAKHTDRDCLVGGRVLELALGAALTALERAHVRKCPVCAWEYRFVRGEPQEVVQQTLIHLDEEEADLLSLAAE